MVKMSDTCPFYSPPIHHRWESGRWELWLLMFENHKNIMSTSRQHLNTVLHICPHWPCTTDIMLAKQQSMLICLILRGAFYASFLASFILLLCSLPFFLILFFLYQSKLLLHLVPEKKMLYDTGVQ